jgi:hypothetical protein
MVAADRSALTFGDRLPGILLVAQDGRTRRATERLYQVMMTDPED